MTNINYLKKMLLQYYFVKKIRSSRLSRFASSINDIELSDLLASDLNSLEPKPSFNPHFNNPEFRLVFSTQYRGIYNDCDLSFYLLTNDFYTAILGFDIISPYSVKVLQLQASKRHADLLPKSWETNLLSFSLSVFSKIGFRNAEMIRAEDIRWYYKPVNIPDSELPAHQERLRTRYNTTARRLGFILDPNKNVFVKKL